MMNKTFSVGFGMLFCLLICLSIEARVQVSPPTPPKSFFPITKPGVGALPSAKKAMLTKAFKAHFGNSVVLEDIVVVREFNKHWVAFISGDSETPTVAYQLTEQRGMLGLDLGGPVAAVNCFTTSSCSCCKAVSCACSKKNGGQVDCGSSDCKKEELQSLLPAAMTAVLGG